MTGRADPLQHHGGAQEVGGREDDRDDRLLHTGQLLPRLVQTYTCRLPVSFHLMCKLKNPSLPSKLFQVEHCRFIEDLSSFLVKVGHCQGQGQEQHRLHPPVLPEGADAPHRQVLRLLHGAHRLLELQLPRVQT